MISVCNIDLKTKINNNLQELMKYGTYKYDYGNGIVVHKLHGNKIINKIKGTNIKYTTYVSNILDPVTIRIIL